MAHKMLEKSLAYYINEGMENHNVIRVRHIRYEDNHMINDVNPIRDINERLDLIKKSLDELNRELPSLKRELEEENKRLDEMGARLEHIRQKLKGMSK